MVVEAYDAASDRPPFGVEVVRPGYRAAGWRLRRVLTPIIGKECKAGFLTSCAALEETLTRSKPRHACINGGVRGRRLPEHQCSIENLTGGVAKFTPALRHVGLRATTGQWTGSLVFYNRHRPHRGYRAPRRRTPATVVRGAVAA